MSELQDNSDQTNELVPLVGMGNIRLGDSDALVRQTLRTSHIPFDETLDPFCWELDEHRCTLSFANEPAKRLVQINSTSDATRVYRKSIVGLRLDEALLELAVHRLDDTAWTVGEVEGDFAAGKPYVDSDQVANRDTANVLSFGTLWVKSLGLGLTVNAAKIIAVAIRTQKYVPRYGLGPLDNQTLAAAADPHTRESLLQSHVAPAPPRKPRRPLRALLWLATLVTGATLSWVIYTMATDFQSWQNAHPVMGKVVETKPPGPFPDELVIEYRMPDGQSARAMVPVQYATVRETGKEVELVYRDSDPTIAMTKLQSRDHFSSLSMNWLIYLIPLFSLELVWLFPQYLRRRRYG